MDGGYLFSAQIFNDFIIYKLIFFFFLIFGSYGSIPWKHPSLFFLFYHPRIARVQFRSPLFCTALTNIHPSVRSTLTIPCLVSLLCFRHVCIIEGMFALWVFPAWLWSSLLTFYPKNFIQIHWQLLYVKLCVQCFLIS